MYIDGAKIHKKIVFSKTFVSFFVLFSYLCPVN